MIDPKVFAMAADLLEQRGLCKTHLYAHHAPLSQQWAMSPNGKVRGTSTVGAIASACVQLDLLSEMVKHLDAFSRFAKVDRADDVEAGKATCADIVALLRSCATSSVEV